MRNEVSALTDADWTASLANKKIGAEMKISFSTIFGLLLGFGAFIFAVYDVIGSFQGVFLFGNAQP